MALLWLGWCVMLSTCYMMASTASTVSTTQATTAITTMTTPTIVTSAMTTANVSTMKSTTTTTTTTTAIHTTDEITTNTDSPDVGAVIGSVFGVTVVVACIILIIIAKRKKRCCFKDDFLKTRKQCLDFCPLRIMSIFTEPSDVALDSPTKLTSAVKNVNGECNTASSTTSADADEYVYALAQVMKPEQSPGLKPQPERKADYENILPQKASAPRMTMYSHLKMTSGNADIDDYDVTVKCPQMKLAGEDTYNHLREKGKKKRHKEKRRAGTVTPSHPYVNIAATTASSNTNPDVFHIGESHEYYNI